MYRWHLFRPLLACHERRPYEVPYTLPLSSVDPGSVKYMPLVDLSYPSSLLASVHITALIHVGEWTSLHLGNQERDESAISLRGVLRKQHMRMPHTHACAHKHLVEDDSNNRKRARQPYMHSTYK